MSTPKITLSPSQQNAVDQLTPTAESPMWWLTGPLGSGTSTVLAHWATQHSGPSPERTAGCHTVVVRLHQFSTASEVVDSVKAQLASVLDAPVEDHQPDDPQEAVFREAPSPSERLVEHLAIIPEFNCVAIGLDNLHVVTATARAGIVKLIRRTAGSAKGKQCAFVVATHEQLPEALRNTVEVRTIALPKTPSHDSAVLPVSAAAVTDLLTANPAQEPVLRSTLQLLTVTPIGLAIPTTMVAKVLARRGVTVTESKLDVALHKAHPIIQCGTAADGTTHIRLIHETVHEPLQHYLASASVTPGKPIQPEPVHTNHQLLVDILTTAELTKAEQHYADAALPHHLIGAHQPNEALQLMQPEGADPFQVRDRLVAHRAAVLEQCGPAAEVSLSYCSWVARWHSAAGDPRLAAEELTELIPLMAAAFGPNHERTFSTRNNAAYAWYKAGDIATARAAYEALLPDQVATLGADHPDTLNVRCSLAMILGGTPDYEIGHTMLAELLPELERVLGPEHKLTRSIAFQWGYIKEVKDG